MNVSDATVKPKAVGNLKIFVLNLVFNKQILPTQVSDLNSWLIVVHKLKEINHAKEQRARQVITFSHKEAKHAEARSLRSALHEWWRPGEKISQAKQYKNIGKSAMRSASERVSAHFAAFIDMLRPA